MSGRHRGAVDGRRATAAASDRFVAGESAEGPAGGRTPGATEPAKSRAQPGSFDLIEANSARQTLQDTARQPAESRQPAAVPRSWVIGIRIGRAVCRNEMRMFQTALSGLFVDGPSTCRIGSGIPLVVHAVRVGSLSAYGPMRAG